MDGVGGGDRLGGLGEGEMMEDCRRYLKIRRQKNEGQIVTLQICVPCVLCHVTAFKTRVAYWAVVRARVAS